MCKSCYSSKPKQNAVMYFNENPHAWFSAYKYLSVILACYFSEPLNYAVLSLLLPWSIRRQRSCNRLTSGGLVICIFFACRLDASSKRTWFLWSKTSVSLTKHRFIATCLQMSIISSLNLSPIYIKVKSYDSRWQAIKSFPRRTSNRTRNLYAIWAIQISRRNCVTRISSKEDWPRDFQLPRIYTSTNEEKPVQSLDKTVTPCLVENKQSYLHIIVKWLLPIKGKLCFRSTLRIT